MTTEDVWRYLSQDDATREDVEELACSRLAGLSPEAREQALDELAREAHAIVEYVLVTVCEDDEEAARQERSEALALVDWRAIVEGL